MDYAVSVSRSGLHSCTVVAFTEIKIASLSVFLSALDHASL